VSEFNHLQSAHCENGVTASLLQHYGLDFMTEPLAFGIGSGIFYIHIPFLKVNNGPSISYRTMPGSIFKRTCKALDIDVVKKKFGSEVAAKNYLDSLLENNQPAGCQVGVFHLPYFPVEYRFHFNAHNLIVYGKKEDNYLISDPIMETVTMLTPEELNKVRFAKGVLAPKGLVYHPQNITSVSEETIKRAIVKGIKRTAKDMLHIPVPFLGVSGMNYTARHITKWRDKFGSKKAGLYLGQIVRMQEEIGTGGGGFRFVYAAFLEEAAKILKMDELLEVSDDFSNAGDLWRSSAIQMAGIYKGRMTEQADFKISADLIREISDKEKQAYTKLEKLNFKY
jgi:hypothetical protein